MFRCEMVKMVKWYWACTVLCPYFRYKIQCSGVAVIYA